MENYLQNTDFEVKPIDSSLKELSDGSLEHDKRIYVPLESSEIRPPEAKPVPDSRIVFKFGNIARWYDEDNLEPKRIINKVRKNAILPAALAWKANMLSGGELVYGNKIQEGNNYRIEIINDKNVNNFLEKNRLQFLVEALALDYYYFNNFTPYFIFDTPKKKIIRIGYYKTSWCRYGIEKDADQVFISNFWEIASTLEKDTTKCISLPTLNYFDPAQSFKDKQQQYIFPSGTFDVDNFNYPTAPWQSILNEGSHADISNNYEKHIYNYTKNASTPRFLYYIHDKYWEVIYGKEFDKFDAEKKEECRAKLRQELDNCVAGVSNAGKSMILQRFDHHKDGIQEYIIIKPVDPPKTENSGYLTDTGIATSYILSSLGVVPSLFGLRPGAGMGAGSGSDIREAFNMYIYTIQNDVEKILEPLNYALRFNGWNKGKFHLIFPTMQTQNNVTTSQRETKPAFQP